MESTQLKQWIEKLVENGEIEKFYHSAEWIRLSQKVRKMDNYECQRCKKKGKYAAVSSVHHVNEVKKCPELALSIYYTDKDGKKRRNLISLCETCHNEVHEKFKSRKEAGYTNEERW